ncbi:MAG: hypothetical protein ABR599_04225 [Gemmatimonadota bacterium]
MPPVASWWWDDPLRGAKSSGALVTPARGRRRADATARPASGEEENAGRGERKGQRSQEDAPSALSRAVAAASGAVVLALFAYLVARSFAPMEPAAVAVTLAAGEIRNGPGGWYVPLEVRNTGGATAKQVEVESALESSGGGEPLTVQTTLDYLAGGEEQRVYAVFPRHPREGRVVTRVRSFQEP